MASTADVFTSLSEVVSVDFYSKKNAKKADIGQNKSEAKDNKKTILQPPVAQFIYIHKLMLSLK